jgi:CRP-like cAMP-binding protein
VAVAAPAAAGASPVRSIELRLLDTVPLFLSLSEEEKQALAKTMVRRTYRKGDVLCQQGAKMVVRNGVVAITRRDETGETEVGRLSPGDYFGESGLFTGSGEIGTARAVTAAVIYEVGQAALAELMRERPAIADEISVSLSRQAKAGAVSRGSSHDSTEGMSVSSLVRRIRQVFELPHG